MTADVYGSTRVDTAAAAWQLRMPLRWGSVFAGAIIGLALMHLANSLWFAISHGSDVDAVARNLHWFGLGSSLFALFVGGWIAGWMTRVRGAGVGIVNGLTVWGLVLVGNLLIEVPSSLEVFDRAAAPLSEWGADPLWASFFALGGGLVVAAIAGTIGGASPGAKENPTEEAAEDQPRRSQLAPD